MNKLKLWTLGCLCATVAFTSSCKKDHETGPEQSQLTVQTVSDLDGRTGNVYYSLSEDKEITGADTASTSWDLKFSGTRIYVNGGSSGPGSTQAQVVSSTFADLLAAPLSGYQTDTESATAISGWYTYTNTTEPQHAVLMVPGKIIVIKTSNGHYAKLEMLSYYEGNPDTSTAEFADLSTRPASKVYTFRYAYQAEESTDLQ